MFLGKVRINNRNHLPEDYEESNRNERIQQSNQALEQHLARLKDWKHDRNETIEDTADRIHTSLQDIQQRYQNPSNQGNNWWVCIVGGLLLVGLALAVSPKQPNNGSGPNTPPTVQPRP